MALVAVLLMLWIILDSWDVCCEYKCRGPCDASNPGCPLTAGQPVEFYVSHVMKHTHE